MLHSIHVPLVVKEYPVKQPRHVFPSEEHVPQPLKVQTEHCPFTPRIYPDVQPVQVTKLVTLQVAQLEIPHGKQLVPIR